MLANTRYEKISCEHFVDATADRLGAGPLLTRGLLTPTRDGADKMNH